jgi:hypothetical protein
VSVEHLAGKRTGRPRGSKSVPPWVRDLRWAYKHLDTPDAVPPSALAGRLRALGREQPDKFVACLLLDAPAPAANKGKEEAGGPAGSDGGAVAGRPLRAKRLFVPERRLAFFLGGRQAWRVSNLHPDGVQVVGCDFDPARQGLWLTLASGMFPEVPPGAPIPDFETQWMCERRPA